MIVLSPWTAIYRENAPSTEEKNEKKNKENDTVIIGQWSDYPVIN